MKVPDGGLMFNARQNGTAAETIKVALRRTAKVAYPYSTKYKYQIETEGGGWGAVRPSNKSTHSDKG